MAWRGGLLAMDVLANVWTWFHSCANADPVCWRTTKYQRNTIFWNSNRQGRCYKAIFQFLFASWIKTGKSVWTGLFTNRSSITFNRWIVSALCWLRLGLQSELVFEGSLSSVMFPLQIENLVAIRKRCGLPTHSLNHQNIIIKTLLIGKLCYLGKRKSNQIWYWILANVVHYYWRREWFYFRWYNQRLFELFQF